MSTRALPAIRNPLTGSLVTPRDWHRLDILQREDHARISARRQRAEKVKAYRKAHPDRYHDEPSVIPVDTTPFLAPTLSSDPIDVSNERLTRLQADFWRKR